MRISGITIPEKKHLSVALTEVYGIGPTRSKKILDKLNIPYETKTKELNEDQEVSIRHEVEAFTIEGDLKRAISHNIKRYKDIRALRGTRHSVGLPVRGQRTKTNARSRKGPRKTMGSGRVKLQKK